MDNFGLNINNSNYGVNFIPKGQNCPVSSFAPQNQNTQYVLPLYNTTPYEINQKGYIKLGISRLPSGENMHIYRLFNGHKIGIIKSHGCPMIETSIETGAANENKGEDGISHLIEHSIYHSSRKHKDVDKEIKAIGGFANAHTTMGNTRYYITLSDNDPKKLDTALDIISDMVFNPDFSKLDKEKSIVSSEAQKYEADEANLVLNALDRNLFNMTDTVSKDILAGSVESIGAITREQMLNYHSRYYTPENSSTVITSDIEPDELIKIAAQKFKDAAPKTKNHQIQNKTLTPAQQVSHFCMISKEESQKSVYIKFALSGFKNPAFNVKLQALLELLLLRYQTKGTFIDFNQDYMEVCFLSSDEDIDENEVFEKLKTDLKKVCLNPPDEYETEYIRNKIIQLIDSQYETTEGKTNAALDNISQNRFDFEIEKQIARNLSAYDIMDMVRFLDTSKCAIGVLYPKNTTQQDIENSAQRHKNYTPSVIIPQTTQNIDIMPYLKNIDISPYTSSSVLETTLPDNSQFIVFNSKTDQCNLKWNLRNLDLNPHNIAAKYVLDNMFYTINLNEELKKSKDNIKIDYDFSLPQGFGLSAVCEYDKVPDTIRFMKKMLDVDFNEKDFVRAKQKALVLIKSQKEESYSARDYTRYGRAYQKDEKALEEELKNLTLDDLRRYYNDIILNSQSTFSASLPYQKHPEIINQAASALYIPNFKFQNKYQNSYKPVYKPKTNTNVYIRQILTKQPEFCAIYSYKTSSNPKDEIKYILLSKIIYKRLYDNLREAQGLAYSINCYRDDFQDEGSIVLNLSSNCENKGDLEKIIEGFREEVERIKKEPPTREELEEAKNDIKRNIRTNFDSTENAQTILLDAIRTPSGLLRLKDNIKITDEITQDDIIQTARYVFNNPPDYCFDLIQDILDENIEYIKTLGDIK